jgi:NlpC/P60 family
VFLQVPVTIEGEIPVRTVTTRPRGKQGFLGFTTACLAIGIGTVAFSLLWSGDAVAAKRPILTAPRDAEQGQAISMSVEPRGARGCRLATRAPGGRKSSRRVPGGVGYAIDARVRRSAEAGSWILRVRCGERRSAKRRVFVSGFAALSSHTLLAQPRVVRFRKPPVRTLSRRNQRSSRGPRIEDVENDGLGAGEGGRAEGAIAWALGRQGDPSYNFWCLKFVAHAFGANAAGFPTAQAAANALGVRDRAAGPAAAPRGALVFFRYVYRGVSYGHVGISLGDGRMVHAVQTVRVEALSRWAGSYLGWAYPPGHWPGRFAPPANPTPPSTTPPSTTPPPPPRRVITVYNKVTNGPTQMREDGVPVRLTTRPWIRCTSRGCNINGTERSTGGTYDAAVCQTTGERTTNGHDSDPSDDGNPNLYTSDRYYGVRLADGTFGFVSWVWIDAAHRGGQGLPAC